MFENNLNMIWIMYEFNRNKNKMGWAEPHLGFPLSLGWAWQWAPAPSDLSQAHGQLDTRMNNTSFFQVIQYQYSTRAPVLQYNTNVIPIQY
jgi:hypothetical protein